MPGDRNCQAMANVFVDEDDREGHPVSQQVKTPV
jgi:hypothetical protein